MRKKTISFSIISMLCAAMLLSCASPNPDIPQNINKLPLQLNNPEKYKFDHFGVVVKNIEKSVEYYSKTFGLEFEKIHEYQLDNVNVKGRSLSYSMKCAFAKTGPVRIELVEIADGESLHTEFLKTKGQGIQHMAFDVKDLESEMARAGELGLELITYFEKAGVPVMAYFETGNGIVLELIQEDVMEMIKKAMDQDKIRNPNIEIKAQPFNVLNNIK